MPEYLHLPPVAQGVMAIAAVALAVVRLLTASRPFWASTPAWLQKALPALLMAIAAIPTAIEHARSWLDVVVAVVVSGAMFYTASRGDKRPPEDSDGGPRLKRVNSDPKLDDTVSLMPDPVREVAQERSRLHNDIPDDEPAEMSGKWRAPDWRLQTAFGVLLACVLGCGGSTPAPKAPCDPLTLGQITTFCSADAYACGKAGKSEAECTAECDEKLDKRAEECRK